MHSTELKQKIIDLISSTDNKEKLKEIFSLLSKRKNVFTADEVFERTVSKFDAVFQKLSD